MKNTVNLHPTANSGEATTATVSFENRALNLKIETQAYGNSWQSLTINFDSPENMTILGNALIGAALQAEAYFKENP